MSEHGSDVQFAVWLLGCCWVGCVSVTAVLEDFHFLLELTVGKCLPGMFDKRSARGHRIWYVYTGDCVQHLTLFFEAQRMGFRYISVTIQSWNLKFIGSAA